MVSYCYQKISLTAFETVSLADSIRLLTPPFSLSFCFILLQKEGITESVNSATIVVQKQGYTEEVMQVFGDS